MTDHPLTEAAIARIKSHWVILDCTCRICTDIRNLITTVEKLREVLEPFAKAAQRLDGHTFIWSDEMLLLEVFSTYDADGLHIHVGDLRRARDGFEGKEHQPSKDQRDTNTSSRAGTKGCDSS